MASLTVSREQPWGLPKGEKRARSLTDALKSVTSSHLRNDHGLPFYRADAPSLAVFLVQCVPRFRHRSVAVSLSEIHESPNTSQESFNEPRAQAQNPCLRLGSSHIALEHCIIPDTQHQWEFLRGRQHHTKYCRRPSRPSPRSSRFSAPAPVAYPKTLWTRRKLQV